MVFSGTFTIITQFNKIYEEFVIVLFSPSFSRFFSELRFSLNILKKGGKFESRTNFEKKKD